MARHRATNDALKVASAAVPKWIICFNNFIFGSDTRRVRDLRRLPPHEPGVIDAFFTF